MSRSKFVLLASLLLVGAAVLRALYLDERATDSPFFDYPVVDAEEYDTRAAEVADGRLMWDTVPIHAPLYSWTLGAVYALSDHSRLAARIVQVLLGLGTLVLVALVAFWLGGPHASLAALGLGAIYWPLIYFEGELLPTTLATLLSAAILAALVAHQRRPGLARAALVGALMGLSAITRLNVLLLAPAALLVLTLHAKRKRATLALAAGLFALPIFAVTAWNAHVDEWIWVNRWAGLNLYTGNNPDADGTPNIRPGRDWMTLLDMPFRDGRGATFRDQEAYYRDKAREFMFTAEWFELTVRKAFLLLSTSEIKASYHPVTQTEGTLLQRWPLPGMTVLLAFAAAGAFLARRRLNAVFVVWAGYAIGSVIVCAASRYRLPTIPPLLVMAGLGVAGIVAAWGQRDRKRLGLSLGFLVIGALVTRIVTVPVDDSDRGEHAYLLAYASVRAGDFETAYQHAKDAARLRPDHPDTHYYLGWTSAVLASQGRPTDQSPLAHYHEALRHDPLYPEAAENFALWALNHGELGEGQKVIEGFLSRDPRRGSAWMLMGLLRAEAGREIDLDLALEAFEQAQRRLPEDPRPYFRAGEVHGRQQSWDAALSSMREAIARSSSFPPARIGEGRVLAAMGESDRALEVLQTFSNEQPELPETHYWIGRVLLSSGRREQARQAFETALKWAPDYKPALEALDR